MRLTHVGICVAELERSVRFYRDALGFELLGEPRRFDDQATATILDIVDVELELVYLVRDGVRIELLGYPRPGATGSRAVRPMNETGLTHLSFLVDDFDACVTRVRAQGGGVLEASATAFGHGNRGVMVTDPDGTRIELIEERPDGSPPGT